MIEEADHPQERRERHEWAVEREEERLQLFAAIQDFYRAFGHWAMPEYARRGSRIRAAGAAVGLIKAVLRDDEQMIRRYLESAANELGYRVQPHN